MSLRDDRWSVDEYPGVLAFQKNQLYVTEEDECLFFAAEQSIISEIDRFHTRPWHIMCKS